MPVFYQPRPVKSSGAARTRRKNGSGTVCVMPEPFLPSGCAAKKNMLWWKKILLGWHRTFAASAQGQRASLFWFYFIVCACESHPTVRFPGSTVRKAGLYWE